MLLRCVAAHPSCTCCMREASALRPFASHLLHSQLSPRALTSLLHSLAPDLTNSQTRRSCLHANRTHSSWSVADRLFCRDDELVSADFLITGKRSGEETVFSVLRAGTPISICIQLKALAASLPRTHGIDCQPEWLMVHVTSVSTLFSPHNFFILSRDTGCAIIVVVGTVKSLTVSQSLFTLEYYSGICLYFRFKPTSRLAALTYMALCQHSSISSMSSTSSISWLVLVF